MKHRRSVRWLSVGSVLGGFLLGSVALAHHSFGYFDMSKNILYTGVVQKYEWANPHVHITVVIPPGQANAGTWDIEGASVNIMARQGWTRGTFKVGDNIKAVAHPMKDGSKGASLFYVIKPNGQRLFQDIARPKAGEVLPDNGTN
jgi:hypothetical protein